MKYDFNNTDKLDKIKEEVYDKAYKGTSTIAAIFNDCVIVGTDTRVSAGYFIAHKKGRKLFSITPKIAMTIAGLVADAQSLVDVLKYNSKLYELKQNKSMSAKSAARLLSLILHQNRFYPLYTELIIAGLDKNCFSVYRLDPLGSLINADYAATGSGTPYMIGFMEDNYKKNIDRNAGIKMISKALLSAMRRDMGSGNDFDILVIDKNGTYELSREEKDSLLQASLDIST